MSPPPGVPLFFAERTYDDAGVSGITLDHTKQFTKDHLEAYSPGCTSHLTTKQQQRIIDAHHNMAHLFQCPAQPHKNLTWPFPYVKPTDPRPEYIMSLR